MQDDQLDALGSRKGAHGGGAGVAAGGGQQGQGLARRGQGLVRQGGDQLHGQILERRRRAVEQLKYEQARLQLDQRRHQRMVEALGQTV